MFFLFRGRVAVCVGAVARSVGFSFVCGAIGGRGGRFNVFESFDEGIHFSVSGKQSNFADGQIRAIFGADPFGSGEIYIKGKRVNIKTPADAVAHGLGYLSEDRKRYGLMLIKSVAENTAIASLDRYIRFGFISDGKIKDEAREYNNMLRTKTPSMDQLLKNLSGGNQQKVIIARWLIKNSDILIFDEPTRGIDVGAKIEVYNIINELIRQGAAVVMISSELPEILGMSDRVAVMHQGTITGTFANDGTLTQEKILYYATGGDLHTA